MNDIHTYDSTPTSTRCIAVFGSAIVAEDSEEYAIAQELGRVLGGQGWRIISGGYDGVMAAASQGAKSVGAHTTGVVSSVFAGRTPNAWLDETITVDSYLERLLTLIRAADAYIALPGGTGTLAEVALVWELQRKGDIPKRPVILYSEFWRPLRAMMAAYGASGRMGALLTSPQDVITLLHAVWYEQSHGHE